MRDRLSLGGILLVVIWGIGVLGLTPHGARADTVIVAAEDAPPLVRLAAQEIRRYLYLCTGELLPIKKVPGNNDAVLVGLREGLLVAPGAQGVLAKLGHDAYWIKSLDADSHRQVYLAGGSDLAVLYAAYRFIEHWGVRFYLHGDTIPDTPIPLALPEFDELRAPLFALRGIQPFHDFPEGPDWWNPGDYLAILSQLPKLQMNFFGLHTYPEDRPAAEPTTWIGRPEDIAPDGSVKAAYPAIWYNTALPVGWGFEAKKTGDYACGAAALYDRDDYGSDIMRGLSPKPDSDEQCNELFNRAGGMFADVFTFANHLGIKTCIGTETPLVTPRRVAERFGAISSALRPDGGRTAQFTADIADTEDDPLYRSVRFDLNAYRCDVPNGRYLVRLQFCEPAYGETGKRVFGLRIEGNEVLDTLDVFAKVGANRALDYSFENVEVSDGRLDIEFVKQIEFPCIAAIAVAGADGKSWKVNCGGPAYQDYAADDGMATVSPEQVAELYKGMFTRIMKTHPLDYYWFWTPEGWTWEGVKEETVAATVADIQIAYQAAKKVGAPFQLATCGWVLGPQYDRSYLDKALPKEMAVSCINRAVGHDPVEPGFADVQGRGKWAIPWMEDDPAMTSLQLWAGRMRRDARDALKYGCTGLMGIHWRTRILSPNIAALAQAAWNQEGFQEAAALESGVLGGNTTRFDGHKIAGTEADELYQTLRWDMAAYRIAVPNGTYRVVLQFAEPHYREAGKRIFGVKIEDKPVVENLNIFARVGRDCALDLTFDNIAVEDGRLDIDFVKQTEYPSLAGLRIEGAGYARNINCGGSAYKDYEADLPALRPHLPAQDFYADWALSEFGPEVAADAAHILSEVDGRLPRPSNWINGPGGYDPDKRPWEEVTEEYGFVDAFVALRPRVQGAGNLERFDYWANTVEFLRATGRMRCVWHRFNEALDAAKKGADSVAQARLAREKALPERIALIKVVQEAYGYLLNTVTTSGAMGTVSNFEQHTFPGMLNAPGKELADLLGEALPAEAELTREYQGPARLIVPTKRGSLRAGEPLTLRVVLLDRALPEKVTLYWRRLGEGAFKTVPFSLAARQTYIAALSAEDLGSMDVEYYIEAATSGGDTLLWPPTAPKLNQTIIVTRGI